MHVLFLMQQRSTSFTKKYVKECKQLTAISSVDTRCINPHLFKNKTRFFNYLYHDGIICCIGPKIPATQI
jgi:hypothetical protein